MSADRFTVERGGRLDAVLARMFPDASRSWWKRRIEEGKVRVDGSVRAADFELKGGETVSVERPEAAWKLDLEPRILLEDKHVLVLDKPAGLIVHPIGDSWLKRPDAVLAEPDPSVAAWLFQARPGLRALERLGIVHRLDRETSGVLVIAKTAAAREDLLAQWRDRTVEKTYQAIVHGAPKAKRFKVDRPVGRAVGAGKVGTDPLGRAAITEVAVLKAAAAHALVEAKPLTGRTHQIRVHLASAGHPVLGDYEWNPEGERGRGAKPERLMLHAWKLEFRHPATGKAVRAEAKVPADFSGCWKRAVASAAGGRASSAKPSGRARRTS